MNSLADLYDLERELREAIEVAGPDSPNRACWLRLRRVILWDLARYREELSAALAAPRQPEGRGA